MPQAAPAERLVYFRSGARRIQILAGAGLGLGGRCNGIREWNVNDGTT